MTKQEVCDVLWADAVDDADWSMASMNAEQNEYAYFATIGFEAVKLIEKGENNE